MDGLREQLYAEALRRGLGQAAGVLVIGDGALWIWRLADDRFKEARQRLDFYHAVQHLAAVGRALYGEAPAKLQSWLRPLLQQLKNQSAVQVVEKLEDILAHLPEGSRLFSRTPRPDGLPGGTATRRTDWQRSRRVDLPAKPMPLQEARPVLESGRRRSAPVPGNFLA